MRGNRRRSRRVRRNRRGERTAKAPARLDAVDQRIEPGQQADEEIVAGRRQAFAPADEAVDLSRRVFVVERPARLCKRPGRSIDDAARGALSLGQKDLRAAPMRFDRREIQRWNRLAGAPDARVPQAQLGAARARETAATVDALVDIEQLPEIGRPAACKSQHGRSVADGRRHHRQQLVVAHQVAGVREDAVDATRELASRNEVADRLDQKLDSLRPH